MKFDKDKEESDLDYYSSEWFSVTSAKIQKPGFITSTEEPGKKAFSRELCFDDYNDIILDP